MAFFVFLGFSVYMVLLRSLFASYSKPALAERPGLGLFFHGKYFLSSALLVTFEKHNRNTLKDTTVPTVPAIRTGQDLSFYGIRLGPEPDGWETLESDNMIWNKAVTIAVRLLQSTMPIHMVCPNPDYYNLKSEYRKEINLKSCRMRIIQNKNLLIN